MIMNTRINRPMRVATRPSSFSLRAVGTAVLACLFLSATSLVEAQMSASTGGGGGSGSSDELTLIIRDTPANLTKIEYILRSIDVPRRQVLIQAHIFDISLTDEQAMGVDWQLIMTEIGRKEPLIQLSQSVQESGSVSLKFGNLNTEHFAMLLNTLKNHTNARSLSNPKVTTISGQEANIKIAQRYPYRVYQSSTATGGTVETKGEPKFVDLPIGLTVTPIVYNNNTIRMKVVPEITSLLGLPDDVPWTETRTTTTEVLVNDNETMMIGGLIAENRVQDNKMMPLADKAPGFLRKLFRSDKRSSKRSELVIFITPRIMDVDRNIAGNRNLVEDGVHDAKGFFSGPDRLFLEKDNPKAKPVKEARR